MESESGAPTQSVISSITSKSMSVFVWNPTENGPRAISELSYGIKIGILMLIAAFIFIIVSFSTPAWLETDGDLPSTRFTRIGELNIIAHLKIYFRRLNFF